MHPKSRLIVLGLGLCALALLPALVDRPVYQLALSPEQWVADANFMSVVGETRILPESLEITYERIRKALQTETSS